MQWIIEEYGETDPVCLYCKSICDIRSESVSALTGDIIYTDHLTCAPCNEYYRVFLILKSTPPPPSDALSISFPDEKEIGYIVEFSCGNVVVGIGKNKCLDIRARGVDFGNRISVPEFEIDLSNKDKLQDKLRTYLIFS